MVIRSILLSTALAALLAGCGRTSSAEADADEVYAAVNQAKAKAENATEAAEARKPEKQK
jgi:hypothetical protein